MGGRSGGVPALVFVRPLLILAAGAAAGAVAWWVLMHEPRTGPGAVGRMHERLSRGDRVALERLLPRLDHRHDAER